MTLKTKRLTVKNLTTEDADDLYAILSDKTVMAYMESPFDYDKTVAFIKSCALCEPPQVYGLFLNESNAMIGHLIFHPYGDDAYELGWVIARRYWHCGYAQEVTESIIAYAKRHCIPNLIIECDSRQLATKHIAEKFGFRYVGKEGNLSIYERCLTRLQLYIPKMNELGYRQKMMSDPATMSYNKGYDLDFDGYHKDTGCIDFPEDKWMEWYGFYIGHEPERFYAYILRPKDNAFIGEVNLHKKCDDYYDMGIVLEAKHRGKGYAKEALNLLLQYAFEILKVNAIQNFFEDSRDAAIKIHLDCGFQEIRRENGIIYLMITADDYYRRNRLMSL